HAVRGDVIQPPDEGADVRSADLGGEQRLWRRENERDVHPNPVVGHRLDGADAVARERNFHDDVLVDRGQLASFGDHARGVRRHDLRAHRAADDPANLLDDRAWIAALFREQRRIGGDAVDDAERHERLDLTNTPGIDEDFHKRTSVPGTRTPEPRNSGTDTFLFSPRNDPIRQRANALYVDGHLVARLDGSDAGGSPCRDDIARKQGHHRGNVLNHLGNRKNQLARARVLPKRAVDVAADLQIAPV